VARAHGAGHVVLAAPVASPGALDALRQDADEIICLETPQWFFAIGQWYEDFSQTSDDEVVRLLREASDRSASAPDGEPPVDPVSAPTRPPTSG
jgi:predicted phosphoribosyltransferase